MVDTYAVCVHACVSVYIVYEILHSQNNGKEIAWKYLAALYYWDTNPGTGVRMVPKLKQEHIFLTSFLKVRVDLAAQVKTNLNSQ